MNKNYSPIMFDPTKEVPSLELCKKLKELEFPQDSGGWYWKKIKGSWKLEFQNKFSSMIRRLTIQNVLIKAPTVVEMLEYIPASLEVKAPLKIRPIVSFFIDLPEEYNDYAYMAGYLEYGEGHRYEYFEQTDKLALPNAIAKLLIFLTKEKYVEFKEGGKKWIFQKSM